MGIPASKHLYSKNDLATHTDTGKYSFFAVSAVKKKKKHTSEKNLLDLLQNWRFNDSATQVSLISSVNKTYCHFVEPPQNQEKNYESWDLQ